MWGKRRWFRRLLGLLLILGCRQYKLEDIFNLQYEVGLMIFFLMIKIPTHSSARAYHTAWTPPSQPDSIVLLGGDFITGTYDTVEILPGFFEAKHKLVQFCQGGRRFALNHSGNAACGIPNGETILMTGGNRHSFVTR